MSLTTELVDYTQQNSNNFKEFYHREMNEILNVLHKRVFNLEIALQTNNQISNRSYTIIDKNLKQNQFSQELVPNSIDTISQRSRQNSDQYLTLEKQFDKLNLSSFESITTNILPRNLTPNQMKSRAYEFVAIFEDAFDQLNIIHNSLSKDNRFDNIDSNPIFIMNETDKFRYEIEHFYRLLMLFFRALVLDSDTPVNKTSNHLSSKELFDLKNRLQVSQDKISKLSSMKKHFHTNHLDSTKVQLHDHLMEEKYRLKIALNYCNNWKQNHILQWIQMLLQIEQDYINTIHQYELYLKQTNITHEQTIQILIEQKNQMKINANKWYEHYLNETIRFEKELTDFRYEFNQTKRQREEMNEEYQRMKIIVEEYNQMQINERLIFEQQKKDEEAIRRIQAWWRGTMIRYIKRKKHSKKKLSYK